MTSPDVAEGLVDALPATPLESTQKQTAQRLIHQIRQLLHVLREGHQISCLPPRSSRGHPEHHRQHRGTEPLADVLQRLKGHGEGGPDPVQVRRPVRVGGTGAEHRLVEGTPTKPVLIVSDGQGTGGQHSHRLTLEATREIG
jgi:hypothetical protein